jgi:uncharacterized membrane-anchored protein
MLQTLGVERHETRCNAQHKLPETSKNFVIIKQNELVFCETAAGLILMKLYVGGPCANLEKVLLLCL